MLSGVPKQSIKTALRSYSSTTYFPRPGDMTVNKCGVIPGEGIGPLLEQSVRSVFDALNVPILLKTIPNATLTKDTLEDVLSEHDVILSGPITDHFSPKVRKASSGKAMTVDGFDIPQRLDLFASVLHAFTR